MVGLQTQDIPQMPSTTDNSLEVHSETPTNSGKFQSAFPKNSFMLDQELPIAAAASYSHRSTIL